MSDELARIVCVLPAVLVAWALGWTTMSRALATRNLLECQRLFIISVMLLWSGVTCVALAVGVL